MRTKQTQILESEWKRNFHKIKSLKKREGVSNNEGMEWKEKSVD
jgi:hypothetical protein